MSFNSIEVDGLFASDLFPHLPWEEEAMATNDEITRMQERQMTDSTAMAIVTGQVTALKLEVARLKKGVLISHISTTVIVVGLGVMIAMSSFEKFN